MDHKKRLTKYSQVKPATRPAQHRPASSPVTPAIESATKKTRLQRLRTLKHKAVRATNTLSRRSKIIVVGVLAVIIACIIFGIVSRDTSDGPNSNQSNGQILENLEYQTILPAGKTITELGGWRRVSPPEGEAVYAYTDVIDGITVSVSQQPLPSTQSNLSDIAKNLNATTKLNGADVDAYYGTNSNGPQSVVFAKNYLLILIKSSDTISDASWINYIKTLR